MSKIGCTFCWIEVCGITTINLTKYVLWGILNIFNLVDVDIPHNLARFYDIPITGQA